MRSAFKVYVEGHHLSGPATSAMHDTIKPLVCLVNAKTLSIDKRKVDVHLVQAVGIVLYPLILFCYFCRCHVADEIPFCGKYHGVLRVVHKFHYFVKWNVYQVGSILTGTEQPKPRARNDKNIMCLNFHFRLHIVSAKLFFFGLISPLKLLFFIVLCLSGKRNKFCDIGFILFFFPYTAISSIALLDKKIVISAISPTPAIAG